MKAICRENAPVLNMLLFISSSFLIFLTYLGQDWTATKLSMGPLFICIHNKENLILFLDFSQCYERFACGLRPCMRLKWVETFLVPPPTLPPGLKAVEAESMRLAHSRSQQCRPLHLRSRGIEHSRGSTLDTNIDSLLKYAPFLALPPKCPKRALAYSIKIVCVLFSRVLIPWP